MAIRHVKQSDTTEIAWSLDEDVTAPADLPVGWYPVSKYKAVGPEANVIVVGTLTAEQQTIAREIGLARGEAAERYEWCRAGIRSVRHPRGHQVSSPSYVASWVATTPPDEAAFLWLYLSAITHGQDPSETYQAIHDADQADGDQGNAPSPPTPEGTSTDGDDTPVT